MTAESRVERQVVRQNWEESERGWGVRPDGYSLHLTLSDRHQFIKEYWDTMPNYVPDTYSRPEGEPVPTGVEQVVFDQLTELKKEGKPGIWF